MSNQALENGLGALAFSRRVLLGLIEDIPEEKWCYRIAPGHNHVLWVLGHIAITDDYFLTNVGKREAKCPAEWNDLFGMGSVIKLLPGEYPQPGELKEALHNRREEFVAWFKSMSPEQLASPLPEDWKSFAESYGILMSTIACHETMHAGQITTIRRSLGLSPVFG